MRRISKMDFRSNIFDKQIVKVELTEIADFQAMDKMRFQKKFGSVEAETKARMSCRVF